MPDYQIKTTVVGADAAASELKKVEAATAGVTEATKAGGKATEEAGEKSKEAGEKFDPFSREFRRLLGEAGVGMIGQFIKLALNPLYLAFGGLIAIGEQWHKRLEMIEEQELHLIEVGRKRKEMEEAHFTAINEAIARSEAYVQAIRHETEAIDQKGKALAIAVGLAKEQLKIDEAAATASERLAKAKEAERKASGHDSDLTVMAKNEATEERAARAKHLAQQKELQTERNLDQGRLNDAVVEGGHASTRARAADARLTELTELETKARQALIDAKENQAAAHNKETEEERIALEKRVQWDKENLARASADGRGVGPARRGLEADENALKYIVTGQANADNAVQGATDTVARIEVERANVTAELKAQQEAMKKATTTIHEMTEAITAFNLKIKQDEAAYAAETANNQAVYRENRRATEEGPTLPYPVNPRTGLRTDQAVADAAIVQGRNAVEDAEHFGATPDVMAALIQTVANLTAALKRKNLEKGDVEDLKAGLKEANDEIAHLTSRAASNR